METLSPIFSLLPLLLSALLINPTTCRAQLPENHVAFFIFGDSLFDAGNNNYLNGSGKTNIWPYGETFFHHPTGRVCDGRTVPDFIAEYAKLPYILPYLQPGFDNYTDGVNFASAGAGVFASTHAGTIHLKLQLSYFEEVVKRLKQQLGDAEAKKLFSKAVYLFSIGGNDYITVAQSPNSNAMTSDYKRKYIGMVLGNFTTVIKTIYDQGGRKFGFQNVGPLGCMPATKSMAVMSATMSSKNTTVPNCIKAPQILARLHNIALSNVLKKLATKLPGFQYSLFDYYTSLAKRTIYASKYGFKVGKNACCGTGAFNGNFGSCGGQNGTVNYTLCSNPSEYVWFDAGHPTESTNKQMAELLWTGQPNVTAPYTLKMFFETS